MDSETGVEVKVVKGVFNRNSITTDDGEIIDCVTYEINWKQIRGKQGFYHLKKEGFIEDWIIFQYILLDSC
jgi:hypothetical protein